MKAAFIEVHIKAGDLINPRMTELGHFLPMLLHL